MIPEFSIFAPTDLAAAEVVFVVLLAVGMTAITAIFFVCWLFWVVLRLVADGINHLLAPPRGKLKGAAASGREPFRACPDPICRQINPAAARYCRQCGRSLERAPHGPDPVTA